MDNKSVQLFHPRGKTHGTFSILTNADIALEQASEHNSKEIGMGRHSNTTEPLPYLCASSSSSGVRLHSVGSQHLQEHLYARVSPKVRM